MKKKGTKGLLTFVLIILFSLLFTAIVSAGGQDEADSPVEKVTIKTTSWLGGHKDAIDAINSVFMESHPNIEVIFDPIPGGEYNTGMLTGLEVGEGHDVVMLRAFDAGLSLYEAGHIEPLNDIISNLNEYDELGLSTWRTEDGVQYGLPWGAVAHGVYFNEDMFKENNLSVPETWDEFITVLKYFKSKDITPLANGTLGTWVYHLLYYTGVAVNFYGGEESREKLINGEMKITDKPFVDTFKAVYELKDYMDKDYQAIDYLDGIQTFLRGESPMLLDGSWAQGFFEDYDFTMSWFPPPVIKAGDKQVLCFHTDNAWGMNKATKHPEEVKIYLQWLSTNEQAQLMVNNAVGFFPFLEGNYTIEDPIAKAIFDVAQKSDNTVRLMDEKLSRENPTGASLMIEALTSMFLDDFTPEQAAAHVQDGLDMWYVPGK